MSHLWLGEVVYAASVMVVYFVFVNLEAEVRSLCVVTTLDLEANVRPDEVLDGVDF